MRVKFYIQGSEPGKQGTVHLEVKEVSRGGRASWTGTHGKCQGEGKALMLFCLFFFFFPQNPESGEYEFRYIFVELEPYSRTIVIEDNRSWDNQKNKQACVSWWVW